jgi:hypothetical protein
MHRKASFFVALCLLAGCHTGPAGRTSVAAPLRSQAATPVVMSSAERDHAGAVQFAIIGDFGDDSPREAAVAHLVHSWQPEFIVTVGDNNYPRGGADTIDANIAKYYASYIAFNPNYTGPYRAQGCERNRFFPTLGNHDWHTYSLAPHHNMFSLPGNGRYYSFGRGPVDFFVVDSDPREPDGTTQDSPQAHWLKDALAASQAPFKLVLMHHPPYSTGHHGSSEWMQWPYKAWGASAVIAGHNHCYERIEVDGLTYIVNGLGGAIRDTLAESPSLPGAKFDVGYSHANGAMHVQADGHRMLLVFYAVDGTRVDALTLEH